MSIETDRWNKQVAVTATILDVLDEAGLITPKDFQRRCAKMLAELDQVVAEERERVDEIIREELGL